MKGMEIFEKFENGASKFEMTDDQKLKLSISILLIVQYDFCEKIVHKRMDIIKELQICTIFYCSEGDTKKPVSSDFWVKTECTC